MKTLLEIIENIKDNQQVGYEDLKYSVLVLDALLYFEKKVARDLAKAKRENKNAILIYNPEWQETESFNRNKRAFSVSPKLYVGENNDPNNPEYQKFRTMGKKICDKVIGELNENNKTNG